MFEFPSKTFFCTKLILESFYEPKTLFNLTLKWTLSSHVKCMMELITNIFAEYYFEKKNFFHRFYYTKTWHFASNRKIMKSIKFKE